MDRVDVFRPSDAKPQDRVRDLLYDKLDRPGARRWLMGLIGTVFVSARSRRLCVVHPTAAGWVHRFGRRVVVLPRISTTPPDEMDGVTADEYLHVYAPRRGNVVVDVGAGYGRETVLFSRMVGPEGSVLAIEAHPATYDGLVRAIELNRLGNVTPLQAAVSSGEGTAFISDDVNDLANSLLLDPGQPALPVATVSLDGLLREHGVDVVDFLKMNIEGGEARAIEGMVDAIRRTRHVAIACHDFLADDGESEQFRTLKGVIGFLERMDFDVVTQMDHPRPWTRCTVYGSNRRLQTAHL